jgi:trans-aconitate 2-methyltransferase
MHAAGQTAWVADWDGTLYEQVNALQQWVAGLTLGDIELHGDEHVLDVGCGDGRITTMLSDRLPHGRVLGIDASPGMIAAARTAHPQLAVALDDVRAMDFDDEFDVVTSFNVLHWVRDLDTALARIRAALHPGGSAFLQFVCAGPRPSLEATAMAVAATPEWASAFTDFTAPHIHVDPDAFVELVVRSGFDVVSRTVDDLAWSFATGADFQTWVRAGFSDWTRQVPGREATFVAQVARAYRDVSGSDRTLRFMQLRIQLGRVPQS